MADLDSELSKALEESEARAAVDPGPLALEVRRERPRRNVGLLLGLLALGGGILGLVFTSIDDAAIYSVPTDQLLANASAYDGKNVRVEGALVKGSLKRRAEPCEYRFSITKGEKQLPVRYAACIVPDTFRDVPGMDVLVTAEGKLTSEGYFEATQIMAKCPSRYEMEAKAKKGEAAPHEMQGLAQELPPIEE